MLAESDAALRVLETSHPPTMYLPPPAVRMDVLRPSAARATVCEFKGVARYPDAVVDGRLARAVAWSYPDPTPAYEALRDHVAFYPVRVDAAWVGDELVQAQEGDFYGGLDLRRSAGPGSRRPRAVWDAGERVDNLPFVSVSCRMPNVS